MGLLEDGLTDSGKGAAMTNETILLLAGPHARDDARLVAAAAALRPAHVTVLIEGGDASWGWSEQRDAAARRDRLAHLLTAVEQATGATVVGIAGDPAELAHDRFDAVLGAERAPAMA